MRGGTYIAALTIFGCGTVLLYELRQYLRHKRANLNWAAALEAEEAVALAEYVSGQVTSPNSHLTDPAVTACSVRRDGFSFDSLHGEQHG